MGNLSPEVKCLRFGTASGKPLRNTGRLRIDMHTSSRKTGSRSAVLFHGYRSKINPPICWCGRRTHYNTWIKTAGSCRPENRSCLAATGHTYLCAESTIRRAGSVNEWIYFGSAGGRRTQDTDSGGRKH